MANHDNAFGAHTGRTRHNCLRTNQIPPTSSLRLLLGEPLDGTNGLPVVAVVVARTVCARIEAKVPCFGVAVVRVRNGRPVGASRTGMAEQRLDAEAGTGKEDADGSIITSTADNIPIHAVHCRPGPVALVAEVFQFLIRRHAPFPAPMYLRRVMLRGQHTIFSNLNPK